MAGHPPPAHFTHQRRFDLAARHRHALALAAAEHVRIALGVFSAQLHAVQHLRHALAAFGLAERGVDEQRLFQSRG